MNEGKGSETNLLFAYVQAVSCEMICGMDEEERLRELLAGRSSLRDEGIADAELQRVVDTYERSGFYPFCWQGLRPLHRLYRIYPDEACIQNLWRQALQWASDVKSTIDEEGQLELIEAMREYHRLHQDEPDWQDQYYEMIRDMVGAQRHASVLRLLLELWSALPEDQETYANARKELLGAFWRIAIDNCENPAGIAVLDSLLRPWLRDEGMMERFEAECLDALVAIAEYQAAPELEGHLRFIKDYADAYPLLYAELLGYVISARYVLSRDAEAALADLQELKDIAAAQREAEDDGGAKIASLVMACFARMLAALADSETEALRSLLQAAEACAETCAETCVEACTEAYAEAYLSEIGCLENFASAHYGYILFGLQARDIPALQPHVIRRLMFMQQQQNQVFMACLNRHLDGLNYPQQMRLAREVFADFPDQEQLMHVIARKMAKERLVPNLSRREAEECLRFMRDCLQRFPKQYSFLLGLCNAVRCLAPHRLQQGETLDDVLLETRRWMDIKLASADFDLYQRQAMLEQYVHLYKTIALMQHGEAALRTLQDVDIYRRGHPDVLTHVFGGERELRVLWDSVRFEHPDAEVREAIKKLQEQGQKIPGVED